MRQTIQCLQYHRTLVILFTRHNCSLCDNAKSVINNLSKKKAFDYQQVDVMASDQRQWKMLYEFDAPVVGSTPHEESATESNLKLHVQRIVHTTSEPQIVPQARKLMHRFDENQVEKLINEVEQDS